MNNMDELIDQVLAIDSSKSRYDILVDLKHTNNVETTINRIFDGDFLNGTERDPSKSAFLIIDSDDDNDIIDQTPLRQRQKSPQPVTLQDSLEELSFDMSSPKASHSNDIQMPTPKRKIQIQMKDEFDDFFNTPPPADKEDAFSLLDDHDEKDNAEPPPSSPLSFLSLEGDKMLPTSAPVKTTNRKEENTESIFGTHFDDDDDDVNELPSATDFFDDLLLKKPATPIIELDDDDDDDDDAIEIPSPAPANKLSSIDRKGKRRAYEYDYDFDTIVDPPPSNRRRLDEDPFDDVVPATAAERREKEKEDKKRQRELAAEERKRQKAKALEERQRQKELKQLEKERKTLFEKENRIRADRNKILKEIIVDVHPDFLSTKPGKLLELVLTRKEAEFQDLLQQTPDPSYTLSWRRKTNSEWDPNSRAFIPLSSTKIVQEPVVLAYIDIPEFTKRIQAKTIDRYIDLIERDCDGRQIMLLIEGLEVYYKKKMLLKRRQFNAEVRDAFNAGEGSSTITSTSKRKSNLANFDDGLEPSDVEECLNYLQLVRGVMLVPTKDDEDTASWIESLTTDLALGRYKSKDISDSYKVGKPGSNPKDTYLKMLQEIQLCTPAIADSVAWAYPTLQSLHLAYQRKNASDGELLLAALEVERSALRQRDRKINRLMSKKIYTVFTSDDPEQILY
ncbi:ercc4 domain-containing protein [Mucor ambiguus]|uniref:Ercc4 domain-containing protein n=1 Tax=Mucor ambiguus TaxID=91626 RepID=A0A0C9MHB9_9FUNG|nr:ercc4 domain-containing protein [Mucor ambiguus]